jgi:hypothetical protein
MKRRRIFVALGVLAALVLAGVVWADVRLSVPEDTEPPLYTSGAGPGLLPDGTIFALHNNEWAAIPFSRPPECVPVDFNLLDILDFSGAPFACPLLVEGFTVWKDLSDPGPSLEQYQGLGAVPVWFVRWSELEAATADGELTILELASLDSLRIGTASFFQWQNHIYGLHPVSHATLVASGTLADGGSFDLVVIEVGLELVMVRIEFE